MVLIWPYSLGGRVCVEAVLVAGRAEWFSTGIEVLLQVAEHPLPELALEVIKVAKGSLMSAFSVSRTETSRLEVGASWLRQHSSQEIKPFGQTLPPWNSTLITCFVRDTGYECHGRNESLYRRILVSHLIQDMQPFLPRTNVREKARCRGDQPFREDEPTLWPLELDR